MKVALNLHGFTSRCGGVETYLINLFAALQRIDQVNEYLVLVDRGEPSEFKPVNPNFQLMIANYGRFSPRGLLRGAIQRICGVDLLRRNLSHLSADVIHHPLTVLNPSGLKIPAVLTFHDMQQEFFPEFFSRTELKRRRETYLPSTEEARAIITVSAHSKNCLVENYGLPPEKVHVIHSGVGAEFRQVEQPLLLDAMAKRYGLKHPFIFYPAGTWPHKNHLRLLEAIKLLVDRHRFDGELVLTGAPREAHGKLITESRRLGLEKRVRWLGHVPACDLPLLYNLASLLIFPSLYEGFGLPLVEAMACGCPIACANRTSLPEIAGDAALLFDPTSQEQMAETIDRLWHDPELRSAMKKKGLERSRLFSWEKAALETVAVYRKVATGDSSFVQSSEETRESRP